MVVLGKEVSDSITTHLWKMMSCPRSKFSYDEVMLLDDLKQSRTVSSDEIEDDTIKRKILSRVATWASI